MAKTVRELPLYSKAVEFAAAVTAILDKPGLRRNDKLRDQLAAAVDSVLANLEEGFEEGTDRAFARYVTIAKASLGESLGHLRRAGLKGYLTHDELQSRLDLGEPLGKMLGGFIKYLDASDFKDRGRHRMRDSGS